jgi:hypothetical protein
MTKIFPLYRGYGKYFFNFKKIKFLNLNIYPILRSMVKFFIHSPQNYHYIKGNFAVNE